MTGQMEESWVGAGKGGPGGRRVEYKGAVRVPVPPCWDPTHIKHNQRCDVIHSACHLRFLKSTRCSAHAHTKTDTHAHMHVYTHTCAHTCIHYTHHTHVYSKCTIIIGGTIE